MQQDETFLTLIYVSAATKLMSGAELEALLAAARARNARLGITGLLLYQDGNFMQVLEGPEAAVREVFTAIERDPRHRQIMMIVCERGGQREFAGWAMAYGRIDEARWQELMRRLAPDPEVPPASTGAAKGLLQQFWKLTS